MPANGLRSKMVAAAIELNLEEDFINYLRTCRYYDLEMRRSWFKMQGCRV